MPAWKAEATSLPSLQFFAFMQPGDAFIIMGHTLSTIYLTNTDVAPIHGGLTWHKGMHPNRHWWKRCNIIDDKPTLARVVWYDHNSSEYVSKA